MTYLRMPMSHRPRRAIAGMLSIFVLLGCTLTIYACSSRAVAVYDASPHLETSLAPRESGLRVGELTQTGSVTAEQIWSKSTRSDRFLRFTSSSRQAEPVTRTITPDEDGSLRVEIVTEVTSAASGRSRLLLDESGDVVIASNLANKIESDFEPMAIFMPKTLAVDERIEREIGVQSKGPMFGSGTGKGTSVIQGIGTQTIETPAGLFEAFVIESELAFAVGPARIVLSQRAWIDQTESHAGIVAEEGRETVKVFGISVHNESRVSVLDAEHVLAEQTPHETPPTE